MSSSIVVGMVPGELLEPYDSSIEPDFISRINTWITEQNALTFPDAAEVFPTLDKLVGCEKEIVVAGVRGSQCVSSLIAEGLMRGLTVNAVNDLITDAISFSLESSVEDYLKTLPLENPKVKYTWHKQEDQTTFYPEGKFKHLLVGDAFGALKPGFDSPRELPGGFAEKVYAHADKTGATMFSHLSGTLQKLQSWVSEGVELVEVFGLWQNKCLVVASKTALNLGLKVRTPKALTLPSNVGSDIERNYGAILSRYVPGLTYTFDDTFHYLAKN